MKEWNKPQLRELGTNMTEFMGSKGAKAFCCIPYCLNPYLCFLPPCPPDKPPSDEQPDS